MFDVFTGWKISVERAAGDEAYIIVPAEQVEALCRLLARHRIVYEVDGAVPGRHHAEAPSAPVVRLGPPVQLAWIQEVVDLAP